MGVPAVVRSVPWCCLVALVVACGEEEPSDPLLASEIEDAFRAGQFDQVLSDPDCDDPTLDALIEAILHDGPPVQVVPPPPGEVPVVLCVAGVCSAGTATPGPRLCMVTCALPIAPGLVGLPVTATTPTGTTYVGTYGG